MKFKNTQNSYGAVSIALHWGMAVLVIGLYFLGLYIVDLTYYDPEYKTLPALHKSLGVVMFLLLLTRILWTAVNGAPSPADPSKRFEVLMAKVAHRAIYLLMLVIPLSGYLISTADGRPILVFDLFEIPALITSIDQQEEFAGEIHELSAHLLMALVALHALAAVKHHWINKDQTLIRMLGKSKEKTV